MKKSFLLPLITTAVLICNSAATYAQDLLDLLGDEAPKKEYVTNAFKSTRVITGHSMEMVGNGVLDFRILHRFGRFNEGSYGAWGLDQATIRLGLDYGITKRLMVGLGRSSNKKQVDAYAKYRIIWQGKGEGSLPFSLIVLGGAVRDGIHFDNPERDNFESNRYAYYGQMIIGRKFSESFSFQLVPTMVHRNLVPTIQDHNDVFAIGAGTRMKLTRRLALTAEYYYNLPDQLGKEFKNPLSLGVDIETGGHVFQLHFTNALGMNERSFITDNTGTWEDGDIHFGFNISRVFTLDKPKSYKSKPTTE